MKPRFSPLTTATTFAALTIAAVVPLTAVAARRHAATAASASCGCAEDISTSVSSSAVAPPAPTDKVLTLTGRREPSEASVSTAAMKYLPFEVPAGVTRITIHREFDHGPDPNQKNTVDFGLFDSRGYGPGGPGFRGWQGGSPGDFVLTGDPTTSSPHAVPGFIPTGRWYIAQYFLKSSPTGLGYTYTITLSFDGPKPPKSIAPIPRYAPGTINAAAGWYAGNLHAHSLHSDGGRPFTDLISYCHAAGFDFVASTEHNTFTAHYHFPEAATANPGTLLLYGNEYTTPGGHAGIIGQTPGAWFDFRIDAGDGRLPAIIKAAHKQGAVFVANHPYAACTSCTLKYPAGEWAQADAIEVWNGLWSPEDRQAVDLWDGLLKTGRHVWAYGGTDYHRDDNALVPAALVYAAKGLSQESVMDGLRRGRVVLSESPKGPRVQVTAASSPDLLPGDTVKAMGDSLPVIVRVTGGKGMTVRLVWNDGDKTLSAGDTDDATLSATVPLRTGSSYVRAELVKPNGDMASLCNPLFVERERR